MPGLVGLTSLSMSGDFVGTIVCKMRDFIVHQKFHKRDPNFNGPNLCAGRVHTGIIQTAEQPASSDGIHVWLDGEFYNQAELRSRIKSSNTPCDDACLLRQLYAAYPDLPFLKDIDGIYSAVIFDSRRKLVHLLIDRYGLRHLYWCPIKGGLAWASEVKAFLAIPGFSSQIDPQSVSDFFSMGYLLDDRTWFADAKLLPPGTALTFDLRALAVRMRRYWSWGDIKLLPEGTERREIIDELRRLFLDAVRRQSQADEPVGISLSGGLDSRALLAAMPAEEHRPIHTVTFGVAGCDDIRIASQIAHVKPAVHHVVELTSANWLLKRMAGVWYTDGQANLLHMHALVSVEEQRKNYRVNLNGFLGDAILGGSYLFDKRWTIAEKTVQRGRRFVNEGTLLTNNFFHNRIPFFANPLMEFTCSIPESLRAHSRIYNEMLLAAFPEFFAKIPWQTTQLPINASRARIFAVSKLRGAKRRLAKRAPGLGLIGNATHNYHNYAVWIRQAPARSLFERMLLDPSARYRDFIQASDVPLLWSEHMKGGDHSEQLCRALTFELWLQQVNGRNLPQELLETEPSSSRFQPQPQEGALCELD